MKFKLIINWVDVAVIESSLDEDIYMKLCEEHSSQVVDEDIKDDFLKRTFEENWMPADYITMIFKQLHPKEDSYSEEEFKTAWIWFTTEHIKLIPLIWQL